MLGRCQSVQCGFYLCGILRFHVLFHLKQEFHPWLITSTVLTPLTRPEFLPALHCIQVLSRQSRQLINEGQPAPVPVSYNMTLFLPTLRGEL